MYLPLAQQITSQMPATLAEIEQHGFIVWLIIGLIVGAIAKLLMPGKDPGGFIVTIIIGLVGAYVGGLLGEMLFGGQYRVGWIMAVVGAMLLLFLYRLATGRRGGGGGV